MARAKLSDELKEALREISDKEKDKLIRRLLPRDQKLVHKLEFQLLEHSETTEERREEVRATILERMERYPRHFYSSGYLLLTLRELSGMITYHKDVTGDKFGEIELNYLMISEGLTRNLSHLQSESIFAAMKHNEYVVKRLIKLNGLAKKVHEDYLLDFEPYMKDIAKALNQISTMKRSITEYGLNVSALINGELD